jgi:hypothetical protein
MQQESAATGHLRAASGTVPGQSDGGVEAASLGPPKESIRWPAEQALDFPPTPAPGFRSRPDGPALNFSDSDWTRDPPPRHRMAPAQRRALTLAIAISVSCLALALALYGIEQMLDSSAQLESLGRVAGSAGAAAAGASTPAGTATSAASQPLAAVARLPASAPRSAAEAAAAEVDARQLVELEAEMKQRAKDSAEQSAQEAAKRKQRAWERFYQAPAFCSENPTPAQMVQCANHHIRARKEFEERYGGGKL